MAYETGTALDAPDLVSKIHTFLVANGFTLNQYVDGATYRCLRVTKNGKFFNIYSPVGAGGVGIYTSLSTGYTASDAISSQPDESSWSYTNPVTVPYVAYHFFAEGLTFFCAIEWSTGKFRHLGIGEINKAGTYVGGEFAVSTYWNQTTSRINSPSLYHTSLFSSGYGSSSAYPGCVRADIDGTPQYRYFDVAGSNTTKAHGFNGRPYSSGPNFFYNYSSNDPFDVSVNNYNGRTILCPSYIFVHNNVSDWYYAGNVDNVRAVNMVELSPGQLITLGSDEWMVFPMSQKNGASGQENSQHYGVAFRKVV